MRARLGAVNLFVIAVSLLGAAGAGLTLSSSWSDGFGNLGVLGLALVGMALTNVYPIVFYWKGEAEHVSVDEAFFALLVLTSPPPAVMGAMLFGTMVGNVYHRRPLIKAAFNLGAFGAAVAMALVATHAIAGTLPAEPSWRGAAAAAAGACVMFVLTTSAVRAIVTIADHLPFRRLFATMSVLEMLILTSSLSFGLLSGLAASATPMAAVLVFPPLGVIGFVLHQHGRAVRDRHQLDLLLDTAVTANQAVGVQEVRGVVIDAACRLMHTADARIQMAPPNPAELGSPIETESNRLWLVVRPRTPTSGFSADERSMLDGLAAIASSSLSSAELLDRVRHQAFHDSLTGLANRFLFEDRVNQALRSRDVRSVGLLFIDLDRFKRVNDSLGHHAGDALLKQVAERLPATLRGYDSAARVGGDEFAVLLPALETEEAASEVARRIQAALRGPFLIDGREVVVTASVGVAVSPMDGTDCDALMRSADLAMYDAKDAGRDNIRRRAAGARLGERLALETELRRALELDELWVAYQPQFDLRNARIVGAEALVRWLHPERGAMRPDEFLPLAEEAGLLGTIDAWVLESACREAAAWRASGALNLRVAVNMSDRHLRSGAVELVEGTLQRVGLPASWLEIEVTEKVAAASEEISTALAELRALGVRVAVDDFGTGYSSLSRLRTLPVDVLKIDQSFIREIVDPSGPAPVVASTISMANGLALTVVAEGVETTEQLQYLIDHGCDRAQGYLLGRPMPAAELREHLFQGAPATT